MPRAFSHHLVPSKQLNATLPLRLRWLGLFLKRCSSLVACLRRSTGPKQIDQHDEPAGEPNWTN